MPLSSRPSSRPPTLAMAMVICIALAGCQAEPGTTPADDGLSKACARCDACNLLDGAICYVELAEQLYGEGKLSLADAKLKVAAEKLTGALAEEERTPASLIEGLTRLASAQFKLGQRDLARSGVMQALALVDQLKSPLERAEQFVLIARAQHAVRQPAKALDNLKQAEALAAEATDALRQSDVLARIAQTYAAIGRKPDAERVVQQALASARAEANPHPSVALARVAVVLEEMGQRDDATRIFAEARTAAGSQSDLLKRASALGEVGKCLVQAKRLGSASEVLQAAIQASLQAKDQSVAEPLRKELTTYLQKCSPAN